MSKFSKFNLSDTLNKSLKSINFITPTPIQEKSIPIILDGNDILGSAQTGTGKTAAYAIPILDLLLKSKKSSVLILIPTRELAKQVLDVVHSLLGFKGSISSISLIGGESMSKQLSQLKRRPRIFVGTPGRINDHLRRGSLNFNDVKYLILDETDRMLDMGFEVQIKDILKHIKGEKQILMFSATIPKNIIKLSSKYLNNPVRVSVGDSNIVAENITQEIIELKSDEKLLQVIDQINKRDGSILVFVKTKYGTEKLAKSLSKNKIKSFPLHGGLRQSKRNTVMKKFREMKFRVLIATDVAARGLDVPHIEHVINYDLPQLAEDFIHRIGRTARAGSKGIALTFLTKGDFVKWKEIQNILNPTNKNKSKKTSNKNSLNRKKINKTKNLDKKKRSSSKKAFNKNKKYKKDQRLSYSSDKKEFEQTNNDSYKSKFRKKSKFKSNRNKKNNKNSQNISSFSNSTKDYKLSKKRKFSKNNKKSLNKPRKRRVFK